MRIGFGVVLLYHIEPWPDVRCAQRFATRAEYENTARVPDVQYTLFAYPYDGCRCSHRASKRAQTRARTYAHALECHRLRPINYNPQRDGIKHIHKNNNNPTRAPMTCCCRRGRRRRAMLSPFASHAFNRQAARSLSGPIPI